MNIIKAPSRNGGQFLFEKHKGDLHFRTYISVVNIPTTCCNVKSLDFALILDECVFLNIKSNYFITYS